MATDSSRMGLEARSVGLLSHLLSPYHLITLVAHSSGKPFLSGSPGHQPQSPAQQFGPSLQISSRQANLWKDAWLSGLGENWGWGQLISVLYDENSRP